ncbi:Hypothetical Protein FCC1311_029922 [Hondaea fermentalgiana]|uniref:Thioesterase domain-containing protein n=1 Tax=Hondaea fermentalgiana TaxID=2315210 RepID=A0A2R5G701_9STRA|nr:Hypothetical Protein FCC1311_029922 [Hondaea fermentalgiana]|eukprot:GBG26770.1 Hypothetical Protein FCC1311_029922 [Hondaea fermentalgiana]
MPRYLLDDDRVELRGDRVLFTRRARGTPGTAHGGSIGAVYLGLVPREGEAVEAFEVVFKAKALVETWTRLQIDADDRAKATFWQDNVLLSEGRLRLVPISATAQPCVSPWQRGRACEEALRSKLPTGTAVSVPDFKVARAITPERLAAGYSHFEFHNKPRMRFQEAVLRADMAAETATTEAVLYVSPKAGSDKAGSDRVSEGALFTALDEVMGATVNMVFAQPLVTGSLQIEFPVPVCFESADASAALLCETSVRRASPGSRRVLVDSSLYALGPNGERDVEVTRGTATFVLLEGKL